MWVGASSKGAIPNCCFRVRDIFKDEQCYAGWMLKMERFFSTERGRRTSRGECFLCTLREVIKESEPLLGFDTVKRVHGQSCLQRCILFCGVILRGRAVATNHFHHAPARVLHFFFFAFIRARGQRYAQEPYCAV
jgi:hypothetical protein